MRANLRKFRTNRKGEPILVACALCWLMAAQLPSTPLFAQQTTVRGEVVLRIGVADGDPNYTFGDIRGLLFDAGGRLVVVDRLNHRVSLFADDGKFLFAFGQRGDGPGDLASPCCPSLDATGRLWVKSRTRFDSFELGEHAAAHRDRMVHGGRAVYPLMFDSGGRPAAVYFASPRSGYDLAWLDPHGGAEVRRHPLPWDPEADRNLLEARIPRRGLSDWTAQFEQPYGPRQILAFGRDARYAHVVTPGSTVSVASSGGSHLTLRTGFSPVRVSAAERDSIRKVIESMRQQVESRGGTFPRLTVPAMKPPIASLWFDSMNRLWVMQEPEHRDSIRRANVYGSNGALLFTAEWPASVVLSGGAMRGWMALGVETDEDGVDRVAVVRFTTLR